MSYRQYVNSTKSWVCTLVMAFSFGLLGSDAFAASAENGEKIFKANCAACHKINDKKLVGPGLAGVMERVPSKEWLYEWVRNSQKMIASGDEYAVQIYEQYNKVAMSAFEQLSNEDIDDIFEYVANPPGKTAVAAAPGGAMEEGTEEGGNSSLILMVVVIILAVGLFALANVRKNLINLTRVNEGQEELPDLSFFDSILYWINNNSKAFILIVLVVVLILARDGYGVLKSVGVYQGYAPEQPIKFSHKIHAGENGVDCVYCHHTAEKSKTSAIPSVNVCMNCHKAISEGKRWGEKEIAKIYAAAGWNPETGAYDKPEKPIKWVKIHNLPDFVYFNHSQHVVIGKQKCQTCHGEVENFDYPMHQESELTMGWCIDCHRKTGVDSKNPYYEKMHAEFKEKHAGEEGKKFNVEAIGGLECAKCHY